MDDPEIDKPQSDPGELGALLAEFPYLSGILAINEFRRGKLDWLAEHIRRNDYKIDPHVARAILALIERTNPDIVFELKLDRRTDIPTAQRDKLLVGFRDAEIVAEVERLGGYKRAHYKRVCHQVGETFGLSGSTVEQIVRQFRKQFQDSPDPQPGDLNIPAS